MITSLRRLSLVCLWCFAPVLLAGSLTGEIDRQQSSLDEPFWLTISIEGSLDGDVAEPETKDFEIQRTGQSTNISIVNGSMTKQTQYTYELRPLREGALTIPPFRAHVDKQDLATGSLTVVVKGGVAPPADGKDGDASKLVFVERELPKTSLYEGEVVISRVRLFTRTRLTGATPAREASPDWRLIPVDGQKNSELIRDGARWSVIEMHEGLIPLKTGKLKAPSYGVNATWLQPLKRKANPRSIFDMLQGGGFGMGEEVSRKLISSPVEVNIKPLPSPQPAGFSDIVGAFSMKAEVSKRNLGVGDTSTVTVEVKGQGGLDRMADIKLNIPGAKIYADKPTLTESVQAGAGLVSTKVFKFAVVPQLAGSLNLGTSKITSFNPFTETYEQLSSDLGVLTVTGQAQVSSNSGSSQAAPSGAIPSSEPTQTLSPAASTTHNQATSNSQADLAAKPLQEGDTVKTRPWFLSPLAVAIEVLLLALIIAAFILRQAWHKVRASRAREVSNLTSHLTEALRHLDRPDSQAVSAAVLALKEHLAGKGQDPSSMTSVDLLKAADSQRVDKDHRDALERLLNQLDRLAYGDDVGSEVSASMIDELKVLLRYFEARGA